MSTSRAALLLPLLLASCLPLLGGGRSLRPGTYSPITVDEIEQVNATDLFTVVRVARPRWLVTQNSSFDMLDNEVVVYYGRVRMGGVSALRGIATGDAASVSFLRPARAQLLLGNGHVSGAIVVEPAVQ